MGLNDRSDEPTGGMLTPLQNGRTAWRRAVRQRSSFTVTQWDRQHQRRDQKPHHEPIASTLGATVTPIQSGERSDASPHTDPTSLTPNHTNASLNQDSASVPANPHAPQHNAAAATRLRVIEPGKGSLRHLGRDLWRARELLYFLTWRDIKVRYKQAALGVVWAVLQPILSMVVLSIFFGRLAGIAKHTGPIAYPVFVYTGLLPWNFFAGGLTSAGNSVISNVALITKIRFPRILLPIAAVAGELVDLGIAFGVLVGLMVCYHVPLTLRMLLVPLLVVGVGGMGLGLGSIFAALTVRYRDFRFIIPFMLQIGLFATPVIYPSSVVPAKYRVLLLLNPLNGWISAIRGVLLGSVVDWEALGMSCVVTGLVLVLGVYYFRSSERTFAEVI